MADLFQELLNENITNPLTLTSLAPTFIFIDGSYFCFYRYYATLQWWKNANPLEPKDGFVPYENPAFLEKFKKLFHETLVQMSKKLKIQDSRPILIVGKDCKRENIWRNELMPSYKGTRVYDSTFMGVPFFKMVYEDGLFQKGGARAVLSHPQLEADDCIAISVKTLLRRYPSCRIYIITSDRDYLQLNAPNVDLYNLSFKNIGENKTSPKDDLERKIIMGDVSDNIPSVFPKCGPKTAEKCVADKEFFKKKMADNAAYYSQYELNRRLIDFDCIPESLVKEFGEKNGIKLEESRTTRV
jgi:5'-3' exonuclease